MPLTDKIKKSEKSNLRKKSQTRSQHGCPSCGATKLRLDSKTGEYFCLTCHATWLYMNRRPKIITSGGKK